MTKSKQSHTIIETLTNELTPVTPITSDKNQWTKTIILSVLTAILALITIGIRHNLKDNITSPIFWIESLLPLSLFFIANSLAIQSRAPQLTNKKIQNTFLTLFTLILLYCIGRIGFHFTADKSPFIDTHSNCLPIIGIIAIIPMIYLIYIFKKIKLLEPKQSIIFITVATSCLGLSTIKLICPLESIPHIILWHILPTLTLMVLPIPFLTRWVTKKEPTQTQQKNVLQD